MIEKKGFSYPSSGAEHYGNIVYSKYGYDVIECEVCGFKHVIPIPTENFLNEYYKKRFVQNRPTGFFEKMEEDASWWKIVYDEKFDLFERYIDTENRKILDIGSGLGYFLKLGIDRGWSTLGIEPSVDSFKYAQELGLDVINECFGENTYKKLGFFDVIHMHEVLEHLPNPQNIIKLTKKMLNPGGLICIVSPNDFNPLQEAFIAKNEEVGKWWVSPPEHINFFNFESITKLLERNGFSIIEKTSTFPLELFLLMGENYIGNEDLGKKIHCKRKKFEVSLSETGNEELRRRLYQKVSELGLGREFMVIGKTINE